MITNKKHKAFADEYLTNGMNGTQAYLTVYKCGKEETAAVNSYKLLRNTKIEDYIKQRQEKTSKKLEITREEILQDLKDIKDAFKGKEEYPPHAMKAIEILNKMLGFNEPDKMSVEHRGITINVIKPKKDGDKDSE